MNKFKWIGVISYFSQKTSKNGNQFYTFTLFSKETGYQKCICFEEKASALNDGFEILLTEYIPRRNGWVDNSGIKKWNVEFAIKDFEIISERQQQKEEIIEVNYEQPKEETSNNQVEWDIDRKEIDTEETEINELKKLYPALEDSEIEVLWSHLKQGGDINENR